MARLTLAPQQLLQLLAEGGAHSGDAIAQRFGISRAAVWKQIEQLRAAGLDIPAQPGHGYRLTAPLDLLDREAIATHLGAQASDIDLAVHWQIDSTNSELLRGAAGSARYRRACLAEIQTRGRGRRGRQWQMPLGGGLALSYLERFDGAMAGLSGLSLVVGVVVVRALNACGIGSPGLKWPNDVVADDRKLAGVLVELGGEALGPCHAVIGIGINVRLGAAMAAAIDQPWTDLAQLAAGGAVPSRNQLAASVLQQLHAALPVFAIDGFAAFAADYARYDVLCGREVRVSGPTGGRDGIAAGVDARGALRVRTADGEFLVDSGEVSVRATG